MLRLQIIIASTREGRLGDKVGAWAEKHAREHGKFEIELVDLKQVNLPLFDEPKHPRFREYTKEHTKRWSEIVSRGDAYLIVTSEYDFGPPASLINALQYLSQEWAYKPAAMVSYGGVSGGTRCTNALRIILTSLKMMPLMESVNIPFFAQYVNKETGVFDPGEIQAKAVGPMLDELMKWATAMKTMR